MILPTPAVKRDRDSAASPERVRSVLAGSRGRFRHVLEPRDGQPADPLMFNSALPPEAWKPGDEFLAASDLRRFRILERRLMLTEYSGPRR